VLIRYPVHIVSIGSKQPGDEENSAQSTGTVSPAPKSATLACVARHYKVWVEEVPGNVAGVWSEVREG
jgi:hypothetical protein